jgi:hypothetical protein
MRLRRQRAGGHHTQHIRQLAHRLVVVLILERVIAPLRVGGVCVRSLIEHRCHGGRGKLRTDAGQRGGHGGLGAILEMMLPHRAIARFLLEATLTNEHTQLAVQKGATFAKSTFRRTLPAKIARIHGATVASFGLNSPQLLECFPLGREIFGDCVDGALENHLQQLSACLTPHSAQVGAQHVNDLGGLLSTWIGLFASAASARGVRNNSAEARRAASDALRLELFKNLLTLALSFPDQLDKAALYCPQHLLMDHPAGEELLPAANQ